MNIFKKIRIRNLQKVLIKTFTRFPLSFLISITIFVLFIYKINIEDLAQDIENIFNKSIFTLILTFFFSTGVSLFGESKNIKRVKQYIFQTISIIFGICFYIFFEENILQNFSAETAVYIGVTFVGILTFVFIAPFIIRIIKKESLQKEFYISSYHIIINTLMSAIVGVSSMLLGFIGLWAIFELFNINFIDEGKVFGYWTTFTLSFFAPIFFLANLPNIEVNIEEKIEDNKFYSFLIKYVGLPAITLYFVILYAYTIKVLINFSQWPQGKITWMVIGFSFFGYLIYFATYIFKKDFKPAEVFRKIFPTAVVPQVAMLFYAITLRINQYDFTINRYLVVTFGVWLLGISLYYIISKRKFLGVIFYSLLLVTILISIGPWSVYSFPENRQHSRLIKDLKEANILQNKEIVPLEKYEDIDDKLSGKIHGSINYLCNFHGRKTLEDIFGKEILEIKSEHKKEFELQKKDDLTRIKNNKTLIDKVKKDEIKEITNRKYREIQNWSLLYKLTEKIKVRAINNWNKNKDKIPQFLNFETKNPYYNGAINVTGYDYYLSGINNENNIISNRVYKENKKEIKTLQYLASIDINQKKLFVFNQKGKGTDYRENIETFDLTNIFTEILNTTEREKFENREGFYLNSDNLTFQVEGKKLNLKIHFNSISIPNPVWTKEIQEKQVKEREEQNNKYNYISIQNGYVDGEIWMKVR